MKVMSRSQLAREKVQSIQAGFSAYAETREVSELIKKELRTLGIEVIEDTNSMGSWFIPKERA
ncbi:hypothetical protein MM300_03325 [Evansella sp. LMS18]|uniref:hypothetical protein n=1 Tax=Evansella sp. LMS18 TaxID=2924033 RepID=UPI0020D1DCBE|nr:hypothetical protein [Evansella sp. LMS18]UTR11375.1 hypothetical protein MM300_03325 [Evansella sp. LMS18]